MNNEEVRRGQETLEEAMERFKATLSQPTTTSYSTGLTVRDVFECTICRDDGYKGVKTPYNEPLHEVEFCDCRKGVAVKKWWYREAKKKQAAKLQQLFEVAGVPVRFRDLTIDSLQATVLCDPEKESALAAAKAMIAQGYIDVAGRRKNSLILSGPYGTGKTGTATPILRYWLDQGRSGLWIEFYDFCDRVQQGYNRGDSKEVMEAAQRADWVLLDDVGELNRDDRVTGFAETTDKQKILYQLVNYRHNHALPTLITSNLSPSQLVNQFGARTFERLLESYHIVSMGGRNLRVA